MKSAPILVIDKVGLIGEPLSLKLSKEFPVVFVNKWRKFPIIPDNKYSHIIVIAWESKQLEFLPKIIEKAKGVNSELIFAQEVSAKDNYTGRVLGAYSSAKVVLYGDIFDNNKFMYQAQRFGKIQIIGDGLRETYPVFLDDVVNGIIDLVFGISDKYSLFYIFPKHPVTELSLAHMIQKANPEIRIDFISHGSKVRNISYSPDGKNLLDDKYPLAKKIRNINIAKATKMEDHRSSKERSIKRFPMLIVLVLILLTLFPLIFTLIFSFLGLNALYFAKTQIDKGSFFDAKSSLHLSQTFFYIGKKASDILYFQLNFIRRENNLRKLLEDIDIGHRISEGALQAFNSGAYFSKTFTGKSKNPLSDFTKGQNDLKNAILTFEKLRGEEKIPQPFNQKLQSIDSLIRFISNTIDISPNIFGFVGEKTYLVLFQNNMELRPGGGFIESYGVLKVNMGKITQLTINDVYDADGQLRGHVEPPFGIRRHLPSVHWYMRDSNFDVDFVKSASVSSNFLYVETGQETAGVIGVDAAFIKNILHAIGPVYVENYKETVDENSLYKLAQAHSEKDFLRFVYKAVLAKVSGENVSYLLLAQAISDSISQKHLVFALNNNTQNILTVNGWSSSLWDERRQDEKSVNDFLGINEANLGVNKVNYFIKRNLSQKVTIREDGSISEELNINYKNTSTAGQGGDYKNYLRIILPKDANLSEMSIQDIPQVLVDAVTDPLVYEKKNFKAPAGLEVEKVQGGNKTIYGFLINVPAGEIVRVKVKYELSNNVSILNAFSYNLKLFKQPGIDSIPYAFSLIYPNSFNVVKGEVSYSKEIVRDENLIVDFARK